MSSKPDPSVVRNIRQNIHPENQPPEAKLYDVDKIQREAAESILSGPVTETYPLDVKQACRYMNEALASEILCVLRYRHHQIIAKGIDFPQVADQFEEHAVNEEKHMLMIAERIDQLGGDPDFDPASVAKFSSTLYGKPGQSALADMIKDDLIAERIVIDIYRKLIGWFGDADPTSRRMFEKILEDEEEHATELADLLTAMN
jgi:bacterioferritin